MAPELIACFLGSNLENSGSHAVQKLQLYIHCVDCSSISIHVPDMDRDSRWTLWNHSRYFWRGHRNFCRYFRSDIWDHWRPVWMALRLAPIYWLVPYSDIRNCSHSDCGSARHEVKKIKLLDYETGCLL